MQSDGDDGRWRRLHASSLLFRMGALAKGLLIPAIFAIVLARGFGFEQWLIIPFAIGVAFELLRFFTLRYRLAPDELVVKQGLVFRSERHVPFRRIQNIDIVQNVVHRALRVAEVNVQTAGGAEPEAVLKVLSLAAVDVVRGRVFAGRPDALAANPASPERAIDPAAATGETDRGTSHAAPFPDAPRVAPPDARGSVILRLGWGELTRLSMISIRGFALIAIVVGLAWEYGFLDDINLSDRVEAWWRTGEPLVRVTTVIGLALAAVPALLLLSIAWNILRLHGYELRRSGEDLRWSAGLLTRRAATVPRGRIQFVSIHRSTRHRWFGRASIRVETASGARGDEGDHAGAAISQRWFVPLVREGDVQRVLDEIVPGIRIDSIDWQPLPVQARRRMMIVNVVIAVIVSGLLLAAFRPWGATAFAVLVPLGLWSAARHWRLSAYGRSARGMCHRSGVWMRKVSVAIDEKVQVTSIVESPFDRRYGMATLILDTAGAGPADHAVHVPYLPRPIAEALARDAFRRSALSG